MALILAGALVLGAMSSDGAPVQSDVEAVSTVVVDAPPQPAYGVYDRLAYCESTGRWWINSGNGYYGGLQMDMTFWRRHGGLQYAARPDLASRAEQISVAVIGQAVQGWGAWPVCSRVIGAR